MRDVNRIVLPPASFMQEKEKIEKRWPAAVEFIKSRKLNEFFGPKDGAVGIIVLGGLFNGVLRALQQLGLADVMARRRSRSMSSMSPIRSSTTRWSHSAWASQRC